MKKKEQFISLILSRSCNQKCWYCDVYTDMRKFETDLDYIKWIFSYFHFCDLHLEISGGEPALCLNFLDVLDLFEKIPWIKKVDIMSNGMIRKNYDICELKKSFKKINNYDEHLIYDIKDEKIIKNCDLDFDFINSRQICILTENVLDYFIENDLNRDFFYFKPMNYKSVNIFSKKYYDKLSFFISKIQNNIFFFDFEKKYQKFFQQQQNNCLKKKTNCFILLEEKKIGECCLSVSRSNLFDITPEFLKNFNQFEFTENKKLCNSCVSWW